jgi:Rrf2 family nitric oxide-sensitive transcriptional repressor
LSSTPGRSGGFAIDTDPAGLRLGDLVRQLEPNLAIAECFGEESTCPLTDACELSSALFEARESFFVSLNRYTLADLVAGTYQGLIQITPREVAHA